jgi:Zn-dependent protease with chaperone function
MLNAFAVGRPDDAVIALTDGLLRNLTLRELAGVLAHETSHIRNHDLWLMGLADLDSRLTRLMTLVGLLLMILALPLWWAGVTNLPWLVIPLLVLAPQLTTLFERALSRARELDADLDAAGLTGDPAGLASALASWSVGSRASGSRSCCRTIGCRSPRCCAAIRRPRCGSRGCGGSRAARPRPATARRTSA